MDPPLPSVSLTAPAAVQPVDASPRAVDGDGFDALPQVPGAKLRLMCSFGGHIMPRPHDKSLAYVGGETRLVVVDRHASFSSLCSRLSRSLLNGRSFTLKYQLPNEDLDSLVSITADEDLDNMLEEYDRVTSSSALSSSSSAQRIRLFLFVNKLETAATMGSLLADAKSETWFVDALNGSGLLPRGLSDSAAVDNCLVNLDDMEARESLETNANGETSRNNKLEDPNRNAVFQQQEMHLSTMADSPMLEATSSSFGSSISSPSRANLPPIRVRVSEEQRMEEQFAQMSYSNVQVQRQMDDGITAATARPPAIPSAAMADAVAMATINNAVVDGGRGGGGIGGYVYTEDERSDPAMQPVYRKPPLPLQPVAVQPRSAGGYSLPSPESVASENSISSATSYSKPIYYQEVQQDQVQATSRAPGTQADTTTVQASQIPVQPVSHPGYLPDQQPVQPGPHPGYLQDQQQQQQYTSHHPHPGFHYVPHPSPYYQVYTQQVDPHQQHHQQTQNYPVYVMPMAQQSQPYISMQPGGNADPMAQQSQPYMSMQPSGNADPTAAQNRPLAPPNPAGTPPLYPNSKPNTTNAKPESAPGMYRTAVAQQNPQVVQVQPQQYMGYTQTLPHHVPNAGYGYEYTNPPQNEQAFYHQAAPSHLASQYQSMTPAAAAAALADASNQTMVMDGNKQQNAGGPQPL